MDKMPIPTWHILFFSRPLPVLTSKWNLEDWNEPKGACSLNSALQKVLPSWEILFSVCIWTMSFPLHLSTAIKMASLGDNDWLNQIWDKVTKCYSLIHAVQFQNSSALRHPTGSTIALLDTHLSIRSGCTPESRILSFKCNHLLNRKE